MIPRPIACVALLLLSALLLSTLSGCGMIIINNRPGASSEATTATPESEATTSPEETTPQTEPPVEETTETPATARPIDPVDFPDRMGEAEERLEAIDDPVGISDFDLIIAAASNTTDVIFCDEDSPLYKARSQRNAMLYERFGVDIRTIYESVDSEKIYDDLLLALQAGDNAEVYLDLIIIPANRVGRFMSKGIIKDMRSLPFYSKTGGSDSGNIGSSRYADIGAGTDAPEYLYVLYFNRTMLGKDGTARLYAEADSGALTWESIARAAKEIPSRASDIGVTLSASLGDVAVKLSGIDYIKKDASGIPKLDISTEDMLRLDLILESVSKIQAYKPTDSELSALDRFKGGEIPFYLGTLGEITDLYDEKTEWGLLPLPSEQGLGAVGDDHPAICLPVTATKLEQTSIWLEGFNAASGDWIRDAFLNTSIEKYLRDNSSCLTLSKILSQKAVIGFERVFAGYYDGLAAATYEAASDAALGNVRYSDIYANKLTAINKKLGKLP